MPIKKIILFIVGSLLGSWSYGQTWVEKMQDPNANFYEIQKTFNTYWANKKIEKGKGWKQFRRWESFMTPRVYPSGDMNIEANLMQAYQEYKSKYSSSKIAAGSWISLGPLSIPTNGGGGRLNCITFMPGNPSTIFVGSPSGGLWKSIDGGATWNTNTDLLPNLGVSSIAINPANTNIMYIATGDRDATDTYTIGLMKSTDGGITWNTAGLNWALTLKRSINKIIINPVHPDTILVATSAGVYHSFNEGSTWVLSRSGNFKDICFNPANPNIIWAATKNGLCKSVNGGLNFTAVTFTPTTTTIGRLSIAVTPADSNVLYILASNNSDNSFAGLWRTIDNGATYTLCSNTPNLLGWATDGTDAGGQGWYDLSLAVSPTDKNTVYIGGVNQWKSTNGGTSWNLCTHWYGGGGKPYVHADVHTIAFLPGSGTTLFSCNDGGLFKSTNSGSTWSDLSNGISVGQMYRLGCSATNPNLVITGWQDNGSNLLSGTSWANVLGGDGMESMIDYSDNNHMYAEFYYGDIYRSDDGAASFNSIKNNITETGDWVTPFVEDPVDPATIYAGFENIWKSTDRGDNWAMISNFTGGPKIQFIAVAPSDPNTIYIVKAGFPFKTSDGGNTWNAISSDLPAAAYISSIAVDPTNPDIIWATISGYAANSKVFTSRNGGINWTNYSGTLPNIPANTIVYEKNSDEALYVGTDLGVFYRDSTMADWIPFNNGLPNVVIDELEIYYPTGKLRAATYGRGLWESGLYTPQGLDNILSSKNGTLKIYPNPGNGIATIDLNDVGNKNEIVSVKIIGSTGKIIRNEKIKLAGDCCYAIDISKEAKGSYIIKIFSSKGVYTGTLIKN
jgi:photosystem II stability/assembly factor-like uncharacterized protein